MALEKCISPNATQLVAWARQASAGDMAALERLLAVHTRRFLGLARRKIAADWRDKIEAEDLVQEAYVEVFAHIRSFTPADDESFYRWVTEIIENRFFDHVRHWKRKKRDISRTAPPPDTPASSYDVLLEHCRPHSHTPSRGTQRDEALGALLGCMARLSDEYRSVVRRVHLQQEPYEAVAADLGRSPEAVRRMCTRAVEKLRECLGRASRYVSTMG